MKRKKLYCQYCHKEIKQGVYCSRECFYRSRKGIKRPEFGRKISKIMLNKKESYKNTERSKNISKARKQNPITSEEWETIKEVKEKYFYISNVALFLKRANLKRYFKKTLVLEVRDFINGGQKRENPNSMKIQNWSLDKMNEFLKDINSVQSLKNILTKYELSLEELYNFIERENLKSKFKRPRGFHETLPEKIIRELLLKNKIRYKQEKYINNMRWRVDFLLDDNIIIEVQGDYWHANPRVYNKSKLNKIQKKNVINDINKQNWILKNGQKLIHIWEMDIYNNLEKTEKNIQKIISGELNEQYYNSRFF